MAVLVPAADDGFPLRVLLVMAVMMNDGDTDSDSDGNGDGVDSSHSDIANTTEHGNVIIAMALAGDVDKADDDEDEDNDDLSNAGMLSALANCGSGCYTKALPPQVYQDASARLPYYGSARSYTPPY
ncbi:hypothetical protein [Limnohabitans sp.]|uniref:hypothetical protein n=1 Tax=Limnohabitans sp. TaxID=1907725 RepID=UPI00334136A5